MKIFKKTPEALVEYAQAGPFSSLDRENSVLRGVKILGLISRNSRRYAPSALRKATRLYEKAKVNVNHPLNSPNSPRDYRDRIGSVRNVSFRENEGLFADFYFNPRHPLAEQLMWDAEYAPENVGFSHNILGRTVALKDGGVLVEEIVAVRSVDLVADPATTNGLFESEISQETKESRESRNDSSLRDSVLRESSPGFPASRDSTSRESASLSSASVFPGSGDSATRESASLSSAPVFPGSGDSATRESASLSSAPVFPGSGDSATRESAPLSSSPGFPAPRDSATRESASLSSAPVFPSSGDSATRESAPLSSSPGFPAPRDSASLEFAPLSSAPVFPGSGDSATRESASLSSAPGFPASRDSATRESASLSSAPGFPASRDSATRESVSLSSAPGFSGSGDSATRESETGESDPTSPVSKAEDSSARRKKPISRRGQEIELVDDAPSVSSTSSVKSSLAKPVEASELEKISVCEESASREARSFPENASLLMEALQRDYEKTQEQLENLKKQLWEFIRVFQMDSSPVSRVQNSIFREENLSTEEFVNYLRR